MKDVVDIRMVPIQRAIRFLDGVGAEYKIILADGSEYGTLLAVKEGKRKFLHPRGTVRNYYRPLIQHMKVGDVVSVPIGDFSFDSIQNGIGSFAGENWGNGSVITRRDVEKRCIEVLRIE